MLRGIAAIDGTGNALRNRLTGNSGLNVLTGGSGKDTLDGKAGDDILRGGAGNDTYIVNSTGDIVEDAGGDTDQAFSSATFTLGAGVENLTLTGSANIDGTGNDGHNRLTGNSGNNVLTGGSGDDKLYGGAGNDTLISGDGQFFQTLDGGPGADTMIGAGTGYHDYWVDNVGDQITPSQAGGFNINQVHSSIDHALADHFDNLFLLGNGSITGTGNASRNEFYEDTQHANVMIGLGGDDEYFIKHADTQIIEQAGNGQDLVWSPFTFTLPDT